MMSFVEVEEKEPLDPGGEHGKKHLETSRSEIVKQLCGEKGHTLFTFLLTSATHHPGQEQIAIVSLRRLRDVAVQLGWSPDTVKRYVAVFRALGLVQHYHDHR